MSRWISDARGRASGAKLRTIFVAWGLFSLSSTAFARGTVLRVDGESIYVDVGARDGVEAGMELRLYHAIVATHPVTKKRMRDTFFLGNLTVVETGDTLAVASAPEEFRARVQPGDEVELTGRPRVVVDPWRERLRARAAREDREPTIPIEPPELDAAVAAEEAAHARSAAQARVDLAEEVSAVWARTLGRPIPERVALWTEYLNTHRDGPFTPTIRAEIASLEAQELAEQTLEAQRRRERESLTDAAVAAPYLFGADVTLADPLAFHAPSRVYEGAGIALAFLVVREGSVKSAWVHYRRQGDTTYRRVDVAPDGDGYLRARLPGHDVRPPAVEYFVEVLDPEEERPRAVVGEAARPARIRVDASVAEPPRDTRHRSRVTLIFDFVDFDSSNSLDQYIQAEADFLYRFRTPVHAMRLGLAHLQGNGGPKDVIDDAQAQGREPCRDLGGTYRCRKVAFTYTYAELELRASSLVSLMTRVIYGSAYTTDDEQDDPSRRAFDSKVGLGLRARIGQERETNLTLGAGLVEGLGKLLEIAFTWDVIPRFPIVLTAQATDQPIPEDFGLRLIVDVGYRGVSWMYPSLRVSYSARDIDHAGIGAGAALNFDW